MSILYPFKGLTPKEYSSSWISPANIAFVKYWGKKGPQIPANPSISMTLKECVTKTSVKFSPAEKLQVSLNLEGKKEDKFAQKIENYLESLKADLPWIGKLKVEIETSNTFPHGAGIASSASGLSAFALNFTDYCHHLAGVSHDDLFFKRASFLSRLGSGSACRSLYGGFTSWGESELPESTDKYATQFQVHPELSHLQDTVLVISDVEKNVSSRAGHGQMTEHAFAESRYVQAKKNYSTMLSALKTGDMEKVGDILEAEALSLHAMMLTSPNPYTLFRPNTLKAIEMTWDFRKQTKLPLYFTLDAGPNLHLIYPEVFKNKIHTFITHELTPFCQKFIDDQKGEGPVKC